MRLWLGGKMLLPLRYDLCLMLLEEARQRDKLLDTELLGTLGEDLCRVARVVGAKERLEGVAQGLASLVEPRLDDLLEEGFGAAEVGALVANEADDSALDLGGWVEDVLVDREEVLNIIPRL